jgi:alpha-2-macroglobulin
VLRVSLEVEAQSDMTWVVVSDPIPAGGAILGTGLGRDSQLLTQGEKRQGWVYPTFEERSFEAFRAYYEFVPKGKWTVEYTLRLNQDGAFDLPATQVEAMYAPEMFGEIPNLRMVVKPR